MFSFHSYTASPPFSACKPDWPKRRCIGDVLALALDPPSQWVVRNSTRQALQVHTVILGGMDALESHIGEIGCCRVHGRIFAKNRTRTRTLVLCLQDRSNRGTQNAGAVFPNCAFDGC